MIVHSSKMNFQEVVEDMLGSPLQRHKGYLGEVVPILEDVLPNVARQAASKLRKESPRSNSPTSGKYAKGWASKTDTGRLTVGAIVYGKPGTYQLAHLLEHGHAKRGGGRTRSIEHIKPVEEWAIKEAYDQILDRLEKIP